MDLKIENFVELNKKYQPAKFHWPRLSGSNFTRAGGKHPQTYMLSKSPVLIGLKESVYHGAVISAVTVGYTMLGKTLIKMSPPSFRKSHVEDGVKLVAIVAISDFTKDYLICNQAKNNP